MLLTKSVLFSYLYKQSLKEPRRPSSNHSFWVLSLSSSDTAVWGRRALVHSTLFSAYLLLHDTVWKADMCGVSTSACTSQHRMPSPPRESLSHLLTQGWAQWWPCISSRWFFGLNVLPPKFKCWDSVVNGIGTRAPRSSCEGRLVTSDSLAILSWEDTAFVPSEECCSNWRKKSKGPRACGLRLLPIKEPSRNPIYWPPLHLYGHPIGRYSKQDNVDYSLTQITKKTPAVFWRRSGRMGAD